MMEPEHIKYESLDWGDLVIEARRMHCEIEDLKKKISIPVKDGNFRRALAKLSHFLDNIGEGRWVTPMAIVEAAIAAINAKAREPNAKD